MGWRAARSASTIRAYTHPGMAWRLPANTGITMMNISHALAGCLMLSALASLPACGRKEPAPTAVSQPGAATVESKGASIAVPASELPKQDATIAPQSPTVATTIPDSASPSQATSKALDKEQESTAMPMPGQANNHSTPESIEKPSGQPK